MHTLTIKNLDQIQETARQFIKLMGDNTSPSQRAILQTI